MANVEIKGNAGQQEMPQTGTGAVEQRGRLRLPILPTAAVIIAFSGMGLLGRSSGEQLAAVNDAVAQNKKAKQAANAAKKDAIKHGTASKGQEVSDGAKKLAAQTGKKAAKEVIAIAKGKEYTITGKTVWNAIRGHRY